MFSAGPLTGSCVPGPRWGHSPQTTLTIVSCSAPVLVATWPTLPDVLDPPDREVSVSLLSAVPQLGTLYQRPFAISLHHRHHHVSAAISKLNFFAGHMALTHRSTFVIACYKNGRT